MPLTFLFNLLHILAVRFYRKEVHYIVSSQECSYLYL